MPGDLTITFEGHQQLLRRFDKLPQAIREQVATEGLTKGAMILTAEIKRRLGGEALQVRSGRLRNSISYRLEQDRGDMVAKVGTNILYARIQEFGGTITPKRAQYLTIPTAISKTPAGVARYTARQLIANPSLGGFVRTFFRHHKLFGVTSTGQVRAAFILKTSVTIPAHGYIRASINAKRDAILKILVDSLKKALG